MQPLRVQHTTTYRYVQPVILNEHRLMLRPRDSHDLRLVKTKLDISPPATLKWIHDVFGNSVAVASFSEMAAELRIESTLHLVRYSSNRTRSQIASTASQYPFQYSHEDRKDLGPLIERQYADKADVLGAWARKFVARPGTDTMALLGDINAGIHAGFRYERRDPEGTQPPVVTLQRRIGTCRDFALLMIEAARTLGFGARFVSGYLHNSGGSASQQGSGATHAWVEIYLPGLGWIEYDPTNGSVGSESLIRVAITRDPSQASPISGGFTGRPGDFAGLSVAVRVDPEIGT